MKRSSKRLVAIGSVAVAALLITVGAVSAGTYGPTGLEAPTFSTTWTGVGGTDNLGTVDGQDGWHSLSVPPNLTQGYDQEVVNNTTYGGQVPGPSFGDQSLRVSNWVTEKTAEFAGQTYSPSTPNPAGETTGNKVFDGTFQFIPTSASYQPGLQINVSPDNGGGGRMSFVSLTDTPAGIEIKFWDPVIGYHLVGTYDRTKVHTIRFLIEFVPGAGNDVLRLYVDGVDIGNRDHLCFTTWEAIYGGTPPVTDSFQFRADNSEGNSDCNLNGATMVDATCFVDTLDPGTGPHGYLFDNVETTTRNTGGPAPTVCGAVGVIAPTATTCQQYRDNETTPMPVLEQLLYTTKAGKINAVSPGVFFYYTKVSGDEGDKVDITEDPHGGPAIPINQGQVVLYDALTCKVVKGWAPTVSASGTATEELPTDGNFIIGVKYNPSSLKGKDIPNPPTVTYTFGMELDDIAKDAASIDLVPKP